ncbi:hypothetical protein IR152_15855 [Clostridioides sp. ES-S-0108-01]|uniref:hypothetical protein n=1 Tax=unclassified Clostridioides TaxID=2635829 RepID=UPI001C13633A|nr:hypothetical protein [Clostridioides sp. ES-S-0107-01]MCC0784511.1 hypothetical protein [Clostridioides sp. ES-S-0108-01]UDN53063.1 hypothetical protein JJC16_19015 [Clostridioides sp. ES-S-0107-01]HBG2405090.1 hypothetical protein [Clostridioides difficile]
MDKIKEKVMKILNTLLQKLDVTYKKISRNKAFIYYVIPVCIILGFSFFFNSKTIFSSKEDINSTPLYVEQTLGSTNIALMNRRYNPIDKKVEFIVSGEQQDKLKESNLKFELREKKNPTVSIPLESKRLDEDNYVIIAKIPKNWEVLSLSVLDETKDYLDTIDSVKKETDYIDNINNLDKQTTNKDNSKVRIYTDSREIETDYKMKEKNKYEYLIQLTNKKIEFIESEIGKQNKLIAAEKEKQDKLIYEINKIRSDEIYRTDKEKEDAKYEISSLESTKKGSKENVELYNNQIKEYQEKISKLRLKVKDYARKNH